MNWLCPLNFWPDDCLSHGIMLWIISIISGFFLIQWIIDEIRKKFKKNIQEREKDKRMPVSFYNG